MSPQIFFVLTGVPESRALFNMDMQMFLDMFTNLFNFVILAVLVIYLLYKPVKRILKARADRVEGDMKDAALSKMTAGELKAEYEKRVKNIEIERSTILDEARKQADERRSQILDEAKAEAQDAKDRASRDIAAEREQVKGAVHQAIIDISTDMAAKLIEAAIDKNAHDRLFSEALAELEATAVFSKDSVAG